MYKVYKSGTSIRIDASLVGFEQLSWLRGRVSLLFHQGSCVLVDHDRKVVQQLWPRNESSEEGEDEERVVEEEISIALNTPIVRLILTLCVAR